MQIRPATPDDAPSIGRVQVETWRAAYRGIVAEGTLAGLAPEERAREWRALLTDPSGARFMFVAHDATEGLLGFAAAGPERSSDPAYRGELYAIYVRPSHQRRGVGRGLVRAVAGRLAAAGTRSMLLWVLAANAPGRAFYEALGGAVVREQLIDIAGEILTEVAYGWPSLTVLLEAG